MIPNSEAGQRIESLASENANSQYKRIIIPLKARSAPFEEWIHNTINTDFHDHDDA